MAIETNIFLCFPLQKIFQFYSRLYYDRILQEEKAFLMHHSLEGYLLKHVLPTIERPA